MGIYIYQPSIILWMSSLALFGVSVDSGCYQEDILIRCSNITLEENLLELKNLPATGAESISFRGVAGRLDLNFSNYPNLDQVRSISIYDSNITHIEWNTKQLRSLYLVNSHLPALPHFQNCCRYLEKLYLRNNSGIAIGSRSFSGLESLKKLKIMSQTLNHISRRTFEGLDRLRRLTLFDTYITSIDEDSFIPLKRLTELYIQENSLEYIDKHVFQPMEELRSLTIYGISLKPLTLDHFGKQKKLLQLGLPLETWRQIDIRQIRVVFPNLNSFTYIGEWKTIEDKRYFENMFLELHNLLMNK